MDLIHARRSVRAYTDRPVENATLIRILEAANRAPSSGNYQAYAVVVVMDAEIRQRLVPICGNHTFIAQAPVCMLFFTNPEFLVSKWGPLAETLYSVQDATIACTFAMLAATDLGLASCWIGAFDADALKELAGVEPSFAPVAVLPIGYAAEDPEILTRKPLTNLFHAERW